MRAAISSSCELCWQTAVMFAWALREMGSSFPCVAILMFGLLLVEAFLTSASPLLISYLLSTALPRALEGESGCVEDVTTFTTILVAGIVTLVLTHFVYNLE